MKIILVGLTVVAFWIGIWFAACLIAIASRILKQNE